MPIRHIDEAQELISVLVDVKMKEVDKHGVDSKGASTDADLCRLLLWLYLSLLHDDPLVDQLLDPRGLLELSQQIEAVLPLGFERVLMQDFARIDIVFLG